MFEKIRDDFQTHGRQWFNWGFRAMVIYRFGQWRYRIPIRVLRVPFSLLYKYLFFRIQGRGIELPCEAQVGRGLRIDHQGGIVVSGYARLGDDCVIRNGVTIGTARTDKIEAPIIGNRVDIGAGAKVLGGIVIGDDVAIGANAVVLQDVPSGSIAVGIPARILPRKPAT